VILAGLVFAYFGNRLSLLVADCCPWLSWLTLLLFLVLLLLFRLLFVPPPLFLLLLLLLLMLPLLLLFLRSRPICRRRRSCPSPRHRCSRGVNVRMGDRALTSGSAVVGGSGARGNGDGSGGDGDDGGGVGAGGKT
jgi:uncharacterized membrane protein YgcG